MHLTWRKAGHDTVKAFCQITYNSPHPLVQALPLHLPMPLAPLFGHEGVKNRLAGAVASGRLPQALLFEGPRGVGKQRLALWLAQCLVCEKGGCGECQACRLVATLQHPDVHWFVPLELSKKGADADKQVELVAEALAEEMAARREQPMYQAPQGLASHSIAAVRLLLRRLALTPALARRKVFIVGDAERLTPQRGMEDAANALLKALEEPPADTVVVLTAADPEALLPTILSRVVRVRVARLVDSVVTDFAQQVLGLTGKAELAQRVSAAEGCIGRLLATEGDSGAGGRRDTVRARPHADALPGAGRVYRDARGAGGPAAQRSQGRRRDAEAHRGDRARDGRTGAGSRQREPAARHRRIGGGPGGGLLKLSHLDEAGRARMVDVAKKPISVRTAIAAGAIRMSSDAFQQVADQAITKGDVLSVSEVAGTLAAKRTAELIPLCHPLGLDHVEVEASLDSALPGVRVRAAVKAVGRTGVEMEALTAVSVALLTVYDMVKAADAAMVIADVRLVEKKKAPLDA